MKEQRGEEKWVLTVLIRHEWEKLLLTHDLGGWFYFNIFSLVEDSLSKNFNMYFKIIISIKMSIWSILIMIKSAHTNLSKACQQPLAPPSK